ncbi:hypothetical protein [Blastopirellula marina]|uniref:Uncharacterized protein n=1 Tax=Blastopirellula marina DSM 3645 TaxID=314230 RepID=A3ZY20_9BACT|nr:hypothetical protein [Blastopirellula marina]EAQ78554.1 hypothetical protein DSM3645_26764 [Blastopirellula marina DSM 3645]
MTTIQGAQSASIYNLQATDGSQKSSRPAGLQQQLGDVLESEGLSSEDQASLENDLVDALSALFDSSEGRPDATAVQQTIASVFEEYGLDAEELAGRLGSTEGAPAGGAPVGGPPTGGRPPGGPRGGGPPAGATSEESADETDTESTLLETLQDLLERLSESDDSETTSKISDLLVSGLLGLDEVA